MNNRSPTIQALPLLILLLTALLGASATPALADHCKGKHKKDPGCSSDNDPGAEFAVMVTFDCPVSSSTRACSTTALPTQHRVQADEATPLTDNSQDVKAIIRDSGILQFGTAAKGQKVGQRSIYWDFNGGISNPGLTRGSGGTILTTDEVSGAHLTQIQVGRGTSDALDFRALNEHQSEQTNLWGNLAIVPSSGPKEWYFLRFEDGASNDQCQDSNDTTTVTVTRLSDVAGKRVWEVVGNASATACEQSTGQKFVLGPFRFVATEL